MQGKGKHFLEKKSIQLFTVTPMPAPRKMIPKIRYIAQRVFWFDASQEELEKEKKY